MLLSTRTAPLAADCALIVARTVLAVIFIYELNLALGVLALMVGFFGAGRVSVDALLERRLVGKPPPD